MSDVPTSTRREFVKAAGSAALGASLFPADAFAPSPPRQTPLRHRRHRRSRQRHVGPRSRQALPGSARVRRAVRHQPEAHRSPPRPTWASTRPTFTNFDEMIDKTKPDLLMVTTVDGFHHEYIIKGARPRPRRDDREAAHDRRDQVPGHSRRRKAEQQQDRRHVQLSLRAGAPDR